MRRCLREWGTLAHGDTPDTIPERHAERLVQVARRSQFAGRSEDGVLEHRRRDLRARGVVGVIATPGCQLEILPKIDAPGDDGPASDAALRRRLVHMLAVARDIRLDALSPAELGWQRDTLLEILIRLFCRQAVNALRRGMPRQYVARHDDLAALRGRLDVARQFSVLAADPGRLACQFDELSPDIAMNQIVKATISRLSQLATAPDNQRSLRELTLAYADIRPVPVTALPWDQVHIDRANQSWRDLLALARLLIGQRYQNTSAGRSDGHALLFEMNVLFEEYIARLAKRAMADSGLSVHSQGGHRDCLFEDGTGRFRTRPDIVIRNGRITEMIIDTKWKRVAPRVDDEKQGVSQADVYQLMAYSQLYECRNVMLLYPHHAGLGRHPGTRRFDIARRNGKNALLISTIDVTAPAASVVRALRRMIDDRNGPPAIPAG
ncbi:McrC family protein [Marinibacterium sp. SX1]|uniref:McrC family protein n=1 Tax=Marinibacterium sp. SX1 TaxID=3388424 RepID=UPI003D168C7B